MQNLLFSVKITSFLLLLIISLTAKAQQIDLKADLLLTKTVTEKEIPRVSIRSYIYKDKPKTFKYLNPASMMFGSSLYVYQNYFSQHFSASCLYHPSCSDFSKQAVGEFGLIKGTLLSFDRLSRCNRIAATDLNINEMNPSTKRFHDPIIHYK